MNYRNNDGYLLLELMIVLLIVIASSVIIGRCCGILTRWHQYASLHLKAATVARTIIEKRGHFEEKDTQGFIAHVSQKRPFKDIPFISLKVTLQTSSSIPSTTFTFMGGVDEIYE